MVFFTVSQCLRTFLSPFFYNFSKLFLRHLIAMSFYNFALIYPLLSNYLLLSVYGYVICHTDLTYSTHSKVYTMQ